MLLWSRYLLSTTFKRNIYQPSQEHTRFINPLSLKTKKKKNLHHHPLYLLVSPLSFSLSLFHFSQLRSTLDSPRALPRDNFTFRFLLNPHYLPPPALLRQLASIHPRGRTFKEKKRSSNSSPQRVRTIIFNCARWKGELSWRKAGTASRIDGIHELLHRRADECPPADKDVGDDECLADVSWLFLWLAGWLAGWLDLYVFV